MNDTTTDDSPLRAAVLASGSGSNFQALLDAERSEGEARPWETVLLISDRPGIGALDRAEAAGIPTRVIPVSKRPLEAVGGEMLAALDEAGAEVIFLAGYLRLIPPAVVRRYPKRMLNIHPALLPAFGGKGMWGRHVHQAVLDAGVRVTGPTVHWVTEVYDEGGILAQWPVPVRSGDTPETLAARVLAVEHRLYPLAAAHLCRALRAGEDPSPMDAGSPAFRSAQEPDL